MSDGRVRKIHKSSELREAISQAGGKLVVVDFSATWCGPCVMIWPIYCQLSNQHPDVVFLKVDVDECQTAAQECRVRSMPTFQFYLNGSMIHQFSGANQQQLQSDITRLKPSIPTSVGRKLGSTASPTTTTTTDSSSSQTASPSLDARQRAAEAAARRLAALTGQNSNDMIDADAGSVVSSVVPTADQIDDNDDMSIDPSMIRVGGGATHATASNSNARNTNRTPVTELFVQQLIELSFTRGAAVMALRQTGDRGIEPAIDWIMENPGVEAEEENNASAPSATSAVATDGDQGGEGTSSTTTESTGTATIDQPVQTAEEIRRQADELQRMAAERCRQKDLEREKEMEEREIKRRQEAVESARLRKELEVEQAKKEVAQAKKERDDDRQHRLKIEAQIRADRERRKQKELEAKGINPTTTATTATAVAPPRAAVPVAAPIAHEEYNECVLQIRKLDGSTATQTFLPTDTIDQVYRAFDINHSKHHLMTTFPRKVYSSHADRQTTLKQADLVPRGLMVLTVAR